MTIDAAQREMRARFVGGCYGQAVSGLLWTASASLATWGSPRAAITTLVAGGFFIFPLTQLLLRIAGANPLSRENALRELGMQVAFVLPLSMPLLLPIGLYRLNLFFPAMMILLGAHYVPFVFLYGMRMFAALAAFLLAGGIAIALTQPGGFAAGAWYTSATLFAFAFIGRAIVRRELDGTPAR